MLTPEQAQELHALVDDTLFYLRGGLPGRDPYQMDRDLTRALELIALLTPAEGALPEEGDPCPSCGKPLQWDRDERILFCIDDHSHG